MGYWTTGFAFTSTPDWKQLQGLPPHIGLRGYRHKELPLWLLDYWSDVKTPEYPFTGGAFANAFDEFEGDVTVERLRQLKPCFDLIYGWEWLGFAMRVASLLELDCYFFAADDEEIDFAARVNSKSVICLSMNAGNSRVQVENATFTIRPLISKEDESAGETIPPLDDRLEGLEFVNVDTPIRFSGGQFMENVAALWPPNAGNPDLFDCELFQIDNLDLEYEQPMRQNYVGKKKRWQFWR